MEQLGSLPGWFTAGYIFVVGLMIGSFANVCIHRIPARQSVVSPRSHCPSCNKPLRIWDNVPVLSYVLLGGKCHFCKLSIPIRYPVIELVTAVLLTTVFLKFGFTWECLIYSIVVPALVIISAIDLEHQIIPDLITLPGIVFGFAAGTYLNGIVNSVLGFSLGGGLFYLLAVVSRGGMGGGDIKYIAGVGALLGWQNVLLIIFLGALVGSCVGVLMMLFKNKNRKSLIPFGPFLALATLISIFFGDDIIQLYLSTMPEMA